MFEELYSFSGTRWLVTRAGVVRGTDGALYGQTRQGGGQGAGAGFRFDSRNRLTVIRHIAVGEVSLASR